MQPMQASFEHQEQAEEAIRKLASLRADRFRMERTVQGADFGSAVAAAQPAAMNELANRLVGDAAVEAAGELGALPEADFHLSVHVPTDALEQARSVITQAGGRLQ